MRADKKSAKKKNAEDAFGWAVFSEVCGVRRPWGRALLFARPRQDAVFRAYDKRLGALPTAGELSAGGAAGAGGTPDELSYGRTGAVGAEARERLAAELRAREDAHSKFSRRRTFVDDVEVGAINERNRVFNKKLGRAFDKYTVDIKQNLERGTAL